MIEQLFFNETKRNLSGDSGVSDDTVYTYMSLYEERIKQDIEHAREERQKTLDEINNILALCNDSELESLLEEIYGAVNGLESLAFYGR